MAENDQYMPSYSTENRLSDFKVSVGHWSYRVLIFLIPYECIMLVEDFMHHIPFHVCTVCV